VVAVALARSDGRSARSIFLLGVASGVVYFLGALYWVILVMTTYGGLAWPLAALVGLLLVLYLALFVGLFALGLARAVGAFGVAGVWLAPCLWVAAEWLRSTVGGGFPWALLGSSQAAVLPVAQVASVAGVFGLSWLVALVSAAAAAVALSTRTVHRVGAVATGVLLLVSAGAGAMRVAGGALTRAGEVVRVGLVQGNVDQNIKWDPAFREAIVKRYIDLSRQTIGAGAGLVVWPETATPFFFELEPARAEPLRRLAMESRTPFIIGTDEFEPGRTRALDRIYNAAVLLGPDGRSRGSYRKMQLVPFGEYVPLKRLLFFIGPLVETVGDFSPGAEPVVLDADGRRVSVAICYESVYPWLSRAFVARGSQLLATITNDAWFGRSSAAYQHFEQGALRAIEQGRYVIRAANTGISGAVDPYGRTLARTGLFETTALTVDVRLLNGRTIYSRAGDVIVWLSLGASVAPFLRRRRR
jgi:apolipoprotein N-acyltransferase